MSHLFGSDLERLILKKGGLKSRPSAVAFILWIDGARIIAEQLCGWCASWLLNEIGGSAPSRDTCNGHRLLFHAGVPLKGIGSNPLRPELETLNPHLKFCKLQTQSRLHQRSPLLWVPWLHLMTRLRLALDLKDLEFSDLILTFKYSRNLCGNLEIEGL